MSMLPVGFSAGDVDTGDIGHSLRFRASASAYLSRTFGTPTSNTGWALSCFLKCGALAAAQTIFSAGDSQIYINSSDQLVLYKDGAAVATSTAVLRDPSSPLHLFVRSNGTNVKGYINNTEIVSYTGTIPDLNSAVAHNIGKYTSGTNYLDGYSSRIAFVDNGGSLTPGDFAYLNTEINEWVTKSQSAVKAVVDAGGTNSFMLDFDDGSSTTTLGYDKSSKGNNWSTSGISLTAGATYDWMLDVPGNSYAVINALSKASNTISDGNLKVVYPVSGYASTVSTLVMASGQWWCEFNVTTTTGEAIGILPATYNNASGGIGLFGVNGGYGYRHTGQKYVNGTNSAYGATFTTNDVIGIHLNLDTNEVTFYKQTGGSGNFSSQGAISITSGVAWVFAGTDGSGTGAITQTYNFGQRPFNYVTQHGSLPSTAKALCQANLPEGAVRNPTSAVAHRWESGSGIASAISIDRSGWTDWLEIFKRTDTTEDWKVRFSSDSSNMMAFNTNAAKAAWSAPSTGTYLGIALRLGATYGIVSGTYTGDNTSNRNITHAGLNAAPTCALVKSESSGSWYFWHTNMTGAAYWTNIDNASPPAQSNTNSPWGTGNWSSTQFMVTNNATNNLNANAVVYRYILFTDISAFLALAKFTGNGSADGVYVHAGLRPQISIEKNLATASDFILFSDKVDTYNVTASYLKLNTTGALTSATGIDITAFGIKHRSATIANAANTHGTITIAKTNGKYSLAR